MCTHPVTGIPPTRSQTYLHLVVRSYTLDKVTNIIVRTGTFLIRLIIIGRVPDSILCRFIRVLTLLVACDCVPAGRYNSERASGALLARLRVTC